MSRENQPWFGGVGLVPEWARFLCPTYYIGWAVGGAAPVVCWFIVAIVSLILAPFRGVRDGFQSVGRVLFGDNQ